MRTCGECIGQRAMCCDYATYLALLIEDKEGLRRVLGSAVFLTIVCLTEIIACQPEPVEGQVKANASESRTLCMSRARGTCTTTGGPPTRRTEFKCSTKTLQGQPSWLRASSSLTPWPVSTDFLKLLAAAIPIPCSRLTSTSAALVWSDQWVHHNLMYVFYFYEFDLLRIMIGPGLRPPTRRNA